MRLPADSGIRHLYPRLPFSLKLRAYAALMRPFTLLPVMVGVLAAVALAVREEYVSWSGAWSSWRVLVHGAATLLLAQIGSNFVNQAHDVVEDRVNKPYRPIPRGLVSAGEASSLGHVLWVVAVLRAATLSVAFGVLVALIVLVSYAYSAPPMRLKARGWGGNLSVAVARGFLGLPAAWTLLAPVTSPTPWILGGILWLYLLGATTAKDYHDAAGDSASRAETLVVRYGARRATLMTLPFSASPMVTLPLVHYAGWFAISPIGIAMVGTCIFMFAYTSLFRSDEKNGVLEGTKPWAWYYASFLAILAAGVL